MDVLSYALALIMIATLLYFFGNSAPNKADTVAVDRDEIDEYTNPDVWIVIPPR